MSVQLRWDDTLHSVVHCTLARDWHWDDVCASVSESRALHPGRSVAGVILDVSDGFTVPGGSLFERNTLESVKFVLSVAQDNPLPVVVVGADDFARHMFDTLRMINYRATYHVRFVADVDAARAYLTGHTTPVLHETD